MSAKEVFEIIAVAWVLILGTAVFGVILTLILKMFKQDND